MVFTSLDLKVRRIFKDLRKRQRRDLKPIKLSLPSRKTFSLRNTNFYARSDFKELDFKLDDVVIEESILTGASQSIYKIVINDKEYAFCISLKPHKIYSALGWVPDDTAQIEGIAPIYGLITVKKKESEVYGGVICEFIGRGITLQDYILENEIADDYLRVVMSATKRMLYAINGLRYAGMVHEDIKPANVLLTEDENPIAYLSDFDLMHNNRFGELRIGHFHGTFPFISLEKVLGGGDVDYRSDLFSWSVCLAKAVKTRYFLQIEGVFELIEDIRNQKIIPQKSRLSHLPGELIEPVHELLRIGLSRNKDERDIDHMVKIYHESDIKDYVYC